MWQRHAFEPQWSDLISLGRQRMPVEDPLYCIGVVRVYGTNTP
jgi:hypothetical protein